MCGYCVMFSLSTKFSQAHLYTLSLPPRDLAKFKPYPIRFNDQLNQYYNEIPVCVCVCDFNWKSVSQI